MRRSIGLQRLTTACVPMEIRRQLVLTPSSENRLRSHHHRASKRTREHRRVDIRAEPTLDIEREHAALDLRGHHTEAEEAPVPQNERASDLALELDLDVPERILGKARSLRKALRPRAVGVERLSLNVSTGERSLDPRVSERLSNGVPRRSFFRLALRSRLGLFALTLRFDAPT